MTHELRIKLLDQFDDGVIQIFLLKCGFIHINYYYYMGLYLPVFLAECTNY